MTRLVEAPERARPSYRRWSSAAVAAVALAMLGWGAGTAAARTMYVADFESGDVTPIETTDNTPGTPITVGGAPVAIAITPDGATAYVVDETGERVVPIDVETGTVGAPIGVGKNPQAIAITPDGKTAYVANSEDGTVTAIDTTTNAPTATITVGTEPQAIAITPDGKTAYVADRGSASVIPIDTATNTAGAPIGVGQDPEAIAITPDGATAYVVASGDDDVVPISTATNDPGNTIALGGTEPAGIAIAPDGATAYVTNSGTDDVTPIDLGGGTGQRITVGSGPQGVVVTPDGATAYVADFDDHTVTPIDTAAKTTGTPIPVGRQPAALAIVPDQAPTAAFEVTAAGIDQPSAFDGSGSSDRDGTVATYHWDFGDGVEETTTSPTVDHAYAHAGSYVATLTVADAEGCSVEFIFTGQTASCNGSRFARDSDPVTIPRAAPSLTATASPGVDLGAAVSATATLGGGHDPAGQVTFHLYGPGDSDCSAPPVFSASVPVAGAGGYPSPDFTPAATGAYRWVAEYSGDRDNDPALAACNAAGTVVVSPRPPEPPTPQPSQPGPTPAGPPSNLFTIGRPKLDRRRGTARLPVSLPGPGTLRLSGRGIATARREATVAGLMMLRLSPTARTRAQLARTGRAVVRAEITFTPAGGSPNASAKPVTLVERRHRST